MYQPDTPVLNEVALSAKTLKKTLLEKHADFLKEPPATPDIGKLLETEVKVDLRETYFIFAITIIVDIVMHWLEAQRLGRLVNFFLRIL
jgi:hypothetical protein